MRGTRRGAAYSTGMPRIRFVLCRPSHPGNVGAAARAMKTMGLADLRLVAPQRYPAPEAQWMATNAIDVLEAATVHASLADSIKDCVAAFALSARPREWSPQVLDARAAAARAAQFEGEVAFVFGNETAGLTNEEMFACQFLVHIPASPQFSSLNLAQAVQVLAYELRVASVAAPAHEPADADERDPPATVEQLEHFFSHLAQTLDDIDFHKGRSPRTIMKRLRRLFLRADLEQREVRILRGILDDAQRMARIARESRIVNRE